MESVRRNDVRAMSGDSDVASVEICLGVRRDALDLMAALAPFHSFMVQRDREHWAVHARVPGCRGEDLEDLVATIERWAADHEFTCIVGERVVALAHLSELESDELR